jgi:DNA primase
MRGTVEEIKDRLDIVEVIGAYTKLEKAGANFKAKCPFHNEKTPSFIVSPNRGTYYCFGCGAKGDIFTFVETMEGTDFRGALKMLAEKAGVEIKFQKGESKTEKDKLYSALEEATKFFEEELENNSEAVNYLISRGVNKESIKNWRIGYAPDEWRASYSFLLGKGFSKELLLKAGLIKNPPEDSRKEAYDVFRGRIIFPLFDPSGKVIAFSGRALKSDTAPKYLNSPDTILFNKKEILYGLDKAKGEIRKKNYGVLVEGQLDLVLSHQVGVLNTVASSGTAFTIHHLKRLERLSPRIILAFDGDSAGRIAQEKSAILGLMIGMDVKAARLPEGSDPAELVKTDPNKWKNVLRDSKHIIEDLLDFILEKEKDARKIGKLVEKKLLPLIILLSSSIERSHFVSMIAKRTGIREEVLWEDLKKTKVPVSPEIPSSDEIRGEIKNKRPPRKSNIEKRLVGIIFWQKTLPSPMLDVDSLENQMRKTVGDTYYSTLIESMTIEKESLIFEAESYFTNEDNLKKEVTELLDNLTDDMLREELSALIIELSQAEVHKDEEKISELGKKIESVYVRMRDLEGKKKVV